MSSTRAAELVPLERLEPAEWNANRVPPGTMRKIRRSIEEFGFVENMVARPHPEQEGKLEVLSGNHRLELLREMGADEAPVVVLELGDADARILAQALNRTRGADDPQAYARLLESLLDEIDASRVVEFLPETVGSIDRLLARFRAPLAEDELPDPPAKPKSKLGRIYELGEHRLLCGDATDAGAVAELLDGAAIDCVITDPPYGVDYAEKSEFLAWRGRMPAKRAIANDELTATELEELLVASFTIAGEHARAGAAIYVWYADRRTDVFLAALRTGGWRYAQTLIWAKDRLVLGRQDYQSQHEPVLYGWKPGAAHSWHGGRVETTVVDDDVDLRELSKAELVRLIDQLRTRENGDVLRASRPGRSPLHPTQKPVWILSHFLWNSSDRGELVYDPFGGSGSTLMAAAATGRRAALVELEPAYCDVIRERYERSEHASAA